MPCRHAMILESRARGAEATLLLHAILHGNTGIDRDMRDLQKAEDDYRHNERVLRLHLEECQICEAEDAGIALAVLSAESSD